MKELDVTVLLPCLNEERTLAMCIRKAQNSLEGLGRSGEILVADNGSTDSSVEIAITERARVITVSTKGYGAALRAGIEHAQGKYIVMADADGSYALDELQPFLEELDAGADLVMGNRFKGGISKGAMPWLHRYVGNPILSFLGRRFFKVGIGDFHCGLRAFRRERIQALSLVSDGMEFASELVVKCALAGYIITEVPTTLRPDGRDRKPHLRTWRDGWRHLTFLLSATPRWLFLYPGIFLSLLGLIGSSWLATGSRTIGSITFDLNSFLIFIAMTIVGFQIILLGLIARLFADQRGILPRSPRHNAILKAFTLERGLILGFIFLVSAIVLFLIKLLDWSSVDFGMLDYQSSIRWTGLVVLFAVSGSQLIFASFLAALIARD